MTEAGPRVVAAGFVRAHTQVRRPSAVPEVRLHVADDVVARWEAMETAAGGAGDEPPFWAAAWPGGQALARCLLDAPATVKLTLEQRRSGVRSGSRCVARTKRTRRGAKRCTRTVVARSFTFTDTKAGPQRHTLSLRRVARGRYVLRAVPSTAGRVGAARTTALRITR